MYNLPLIEIQACEDMDQFFRFLNKYYLLKLSYCPHNSDAGIGSYAPSLIGIGSSPLLIRWISFHSSAQLRHSGSLLLFIIKLGTLCGLYVIIFPQFIHRLITYAYITKPFSWFKTVVLQSITFDNINCYFLEIFKIMTLSISKTTVFNIITCLLVFIFIILYIIFITN